MPDSITARSAMPTRKWWAMFITSLAAFLVNWIAAGELSKEILIALVGLVAQAAVSYLVPNAETPGGVPLKR
jgi:multisubunit Na+/H+ antiporter MnhG subunit